MKKCLECDANVDEGAYVCPKCGSSTLMGSYSGADALSMLDTMKNQAAAAEHVDRGAKLFFESRFDEAAVELKDAINLAPQNATAHGNMGHLLIKQGKPAEAIPWLQKALELNPKIEGAASALVEAKQAASAKNGCFVATACFGDPGCVEVNVLRAWRDQYLAFSVWGRAAIRAYYSVSPPMAVWLQSRPKARMAVREKLLRPLVNRIVDRMKH